MCILVRTVITLKVCFVSSTYLLLYLSINYLLFHTRLSCVHELTVVILNSIELLFYHKNSHLLANVDVGLTIPKVIGR
jgi:hypothetical protein